MNTELFPATQRALVSLIAPLRDAAADPLLLADWLASLGYTASISGNPALTPILAKVDAFATELATAPHDSWEDFAKLLTTGRQLTGIIDDIRMLAAALDPRMNAGQLAEEILALLLATWLRREHPVLFHAAATLRIIEPRETSAVDPAVSIDGVITRHRRTIDRLRLDAIGDLLTNPGQLLANAYLPNQSATAPDAWAGATRLFAALSLLADRLGVARRVQYRASTVLTAPPTGDTLPTPPEVADEPLEADDGTAPAPPPAEVPPAYFASLFPTFTARLAKSDASELSLGLKASSAAHAGAIPGYVLSPAGTFQLSRTVNDWTLTISSAGTIPSLTLTSAGVAVVADTGAGATGAARIRVERPAAERAIAGDPDGTRLEIGALSIEGGVTHDASGTELFITAGTTQSAIVIAADDSDGFIAALLPADGLRAELGLGLGWSSTRGVHLHASGGLEADLPIALRVAGLTVSNVHIGLRADDAHVSAEISATFSAAIGPVYARIDRVGIQGGLTFPANGGNLGAADLSVGFKGPSGVALSVDAGIICGGGSLIHFESLGVYGGAMQLSIADLLTVKAFGLIATRMPDGSPGYSLIVFITAEDFRPIPLGFGFNLLGIGGMVAINRTFDVEVLRQGLKNDTLGSLLFPRDPVGNAPALINALSSAFPARRGSYMFGLLAKIGWFTPTLVLLDLALILEFGARNRLLALGRISAMLPSRENDLVRLNLDAMGVIDFDAKTAAIDAVLVDSRLVHKFPITGAGALRAGLGSGPESTFVLAIGGLNPHFAAPSGFPSLERVTLALCSGNNPRLTCEAYFAITANTLQFGARASLYAGAGGFSIEGDIGYDVLVQWVPLHFIADYHARLQLKRGSSSLFMLEVVGELEGPRPLRLSGKATFKILFCHFSVRFDKTLVEGEPPPLPPAVDVKAELIKALTAQQAWSTQNPNSPAHGVALRSLPATAGAPLVLDPLGLITVKQQVVPLNTAVDIDTFGGAPVANERRFTLSASLSSDSTPLPQSALSATFAPSQFFAISEEERLTGPSFETYEAGCTFGTEGTKIDERAEAIIAAPLEYATYLIDLSTPEQPPQSAPSYSPSVERLRTLANSGAAGRALTRRVGRTRFANAQATPAASLKPKRWSIVPKGTGDAASVAPSLRTWSEYRATLNSLNRSRAHWQLVPKYETEL